MKARIVLFILGIFILGGPAFAERPCKIFQCFKKTAPEPAMVSEPQVPPLPTEEEIPSYDFSSYEGATKAAIEDLKWREERHAIWIAREEQARDRLISVNGALDILPPLEDIGVLSDRGTVSGDILRDSQYRLEVAAVAAKRHGEGELAERFASEAFWVLQWRGIAEMHPMPPQSQRRLWERIATVWSRNAEAVAGVGFVVKDEPYRNLIEKLSPEAARTIQSGSVWSNIFGVDQFYSLVDSTSPESWLFFKIIPVEAFHGEEGAPTEIKAPHGDLQKEIAELVYYMSRR